MQAFFPLENLFLFSSLLFLANILGSSSFFELKRGIFSRILDIVCNQLSLVCSFGWNFCNKLRRIIQLNRHFLLSSCSSSTEIPPWIEFYQTISYPPGMKKRQKNRREKKNKKVIHYVICKGFCYEYIIIFLPLSLFLFSNNFSLFHLLSVTNAGFSYISSICRLFYPAAAHLPRNFTFFFLLLSFRILFSIAVLQPSQKPNPMESRFVEQNS